MEEVKVDIFPHLLLSYNELSSTLKRCFSYCVVFPKDSEIFVEDLIKDWMAFGYLGSNIGDMELKGRDFFDVLAMRSLFQDFKNYGLDEVQSFKMHDIVHDFAQFVRRSGKVEHEPEGMNQITICRACNPSLVSTVNQFCSLYCEGETPLITLCDCLVRLRVLSLAYNYDLRSIPQGIVNLIHLRKLRLFGIDKLSCEEVKIIFRLYNLQTLSLEDCNIEEIPMEIENLKHLEYLYLCGNKSLEELPREIGNLIRLKYLDLRWNRSLKEVPESICYQIVAQIIEWWNKLQNDPINSILLNCRSNF
ncbi:hypothetical protein ACS0TY_019060 [Phlomoides rotata]